MDRDSVLEASSAALMHDLGAPLRSLVASIQVLRRSDALNGDAHARRLVDHMEGAVRRMAGLTGSLQPPLRGGITPVRMVDLQLHVAEALSDLAADMARAGTRVTVGPLPSVAGEPVLLRRLLQNLLANAIKFRRVEDHWVEVRGSIRSGMARIVVRDNGIGIGRAQQQDIFRPGHRAASAAGYPGTGTGLATCAHVVRLHGGRIAVESTPGRGSAFHVTLPAWRGGAPDEGRRSAHHPA